MFLVLATVATVVTVVTVALGQSSLPKNLHPTNVDFSEGEMGRIPPGWNVPPAVLEAGYSVELRREDCPGISSACVMFRSPAAIKTVRAAELAQTFPALPYLGKKIRFSAWLRAQGPGGDVELRMRVDYADRRVEFFDSVDGPVDGVAPQRREVLGRVNPGAMFISIWARFHPSGPAWVFEPWFGTVDEDDEKVRALIGKFADARNAHDGDGVAALYAEDGEWFGPQGQPAVRGRQALATLWGNLPGQVGRTIQAVDFPGGNIAVVRVTTQYAEPIGRHHETFVAVKENGTWHIRIHQSVD